MKNTHRKRRSRVTCRLKLTSLLLVALAANSGVTMAGTCTELPLSFWTCTGAAGADATENLDAGAGALTVTTSAPFGITVAVGNAFDLTATTGINFSNSAPGAVITGAYSGIVARNTGLGAIDIDTSDAIVTASVFGISARNQAAGTDINVTTGDVTAGGIGVFVVNYGTGATTIDTTAGTVTGVTPGMYGFGNYGSGITVNAYGTDLTITTASVSGGSYGIYAKNNGTGAITIDTTAGTVTATNTRNQSSGIFALSYATDITITTAAVSGGRNGIFAQNYGTGSTTINTTAGTVTGSTVYGILARVLGTDLAITTAAVSGGSFGIAAVNDGTGATTINTTAGTVNGTGATSTGIFASNAGTDLSITTAAVSGAFGIAAQNNGTGATTINTTAGTVTGISNNGIVAATYGTDLAITTAAVSGGIYGIAALNYGSGATTVNTTAGAVTGTNAVGILARNSGTDLTISTAAVSGGNSGIVAQNYGSGATTINITTGVVTGTNGSGIQLRAGANASVINVGNVSTVRGGFAGIDAFSTGGAITINNLGSISNLANTSNRLAIRSLTGPTTINNSDLITGTVLLSGLADTFNNVGGSTWNTAGSSNDFGLGADVLNNSGLIITGNSSGTAQFTNFLGLETFNHNAGAVLRMQDGGTGDVTTFSGNFIGGGGTINMDTVLGNSASATDLLVIQGNSSGSSSLYINNVGGIGDFTTGNGILVVDVAGASAAGAFSLANNLTVGIFQYDLFQNGILTPADGDWYLRSSVRNIVAPSLMLPSMSSAASLAVLGNLHDRVGEQEQASGDGKDRGGVWARWIGTANSDTFMTSAGAFGSSSRGQFAQVGADLYRGENTHWGVYAAMGNNDIASKDVLNSKTGGINLDSKTLGAYFTRYADNYYLDAVLQYSWLDSDVVGGFNSYSTKGNAWMASIEGGLSFARTDNSHFEAQGQLIFGRASTDAASDGSVAYSFEDDTTSLARVGLRWASHQGAFTPYVKFNVWHNFGGDTTVTAGGTPITSGIGESWSSLGAGFSVLTKHDWSIFMSYDFEKGFSGSDRSNNTGSVGIRKNW